ncbi:ABC-2 family transporter protein [compost metagenome]
MAISFGLAVSYLLKGAASRGLLIIIVQLASFFGGAYFPVSDDGSGAMELAVKLSPIRWANHALTELIYNGSSAAAWQTIGLNLALGVVLLIAAAVMMSRREGL